MSKKKPCGLDYCPQEEIFGAYASCSACAYGNDNDNEELEARVDAIIQHGLSELKIPDYSKEFDKFDDETRMMFACMFLINGSFIGEEGKAVLREWLKETAMMA